MIEDINLVLEVLLSSFCLFLFIKENDIYKNNLEKSSRSLNISFIYGLLVSIFLRCLGVLNQKIFFYYFDIIIMTIMTMEDEFSYEISLVYLLSLFINRSIYAIYFDKISFVSIGLAFSINYLIYIISKRKIGCGDIFLNVIISIGINKAYDYYVFFTASYFLGAMWSIIFIIRSKEDFKEKVAFVKFLFMAYLILLIRSIYV